MKTLQVVKVSKINKDKNGNPLNIFVLALANGQPAIVRSAREFLTDLKEASLIGDNVENPNHPEVLAILRDLKSSPFHVTGEIKHAKKGELWEVTATSLAVTDPNHPEYGNVSVGDKLPYKKDMTIVTDGFLTVRVSDEVMFRINRIAAYSASLTSMIDNYDMTATANNSTASNDEVDFDAIPDSVMSEAAGATAN